MRVRGACLCASVKLPSVTALNGDYHKQEQTGYVESNTVSLLARGVDGMIQTGLIQSAHDDLVTDLSYDYYGLHLATCSLDQR